MPHLEAQLKNIEAKDKESEVIMKQEENQSPDHPVEVKEVESQTQKVDTYKIEAINTMLDDFDNIIAKNICVYTNYEDFSFAETRNKNQLETQFQEFVKRNFSGEFQIQSWFGQQIIPRIYFL